jgi:hypothetical protein
MGDKSKSIFIMVFLSLALLSMLNLTSADTTDNVQDFGEVAQYKSILLKQNCVNVTYVNITSVSVTGETTQELLSSQVNMTLVTDGYQTYNWTNTNYTGEYIVMGKCNENGVVVPWSYSFLVSPSGTTISPVGISIYIFFLLICIVVIVYSVIIFKENRMSKDIIKFGELYETKKRNEFLYYMEVLKKKLWIVGVFGVYLGLFVFFALLNQLVYDLGLTDLNNIIRYFVLIMGWGLIPFTVFWLVYMIIIFYKWTTETMKYQFGSLARGGK